MGWENHRNAKDFSRAERISMGLANTGRERRVRQNVDQHDYEAEVRGMKSARGGSTPRPSKPEKLSWSEKRAADKILKEGKQPRGKK